MSLESWSLGPQQPSLGAFLNNQTLEPWSLNNQALEPSSTTKPWSLGASTTKPWSLPQEPNLGALEPQQPSLGASTATNKLKILQLLDHGCCWCRSFYNKPKLVLRKAHGSMSLASHCVG